jgi:hypothetical protein
MGRTRRCDISHKLRRAIWEQAIAFANSLAGEGMWESWANKLDIPRDRKPEEVVFGDDQRNFLFERLAMCRGDWLGEADRRIDLRILLAGGTDTTRRIDPTRGEIARLMLENSNIDDQGLCREMDRRNENFLSRSGDDPGRCRVPFPLPEFLECKGLRLWDDAFGPDREREVQRVHELLSKIRRQFAIQREIIPSL